MEQRRISTGVRGLDDVLRGGLQPYRAYLVRGGPGTGKTTLGMNFLAAGARRGERTLCISFGEAPEQLRANARGIGLDVEHIEFLDLSPDTAFFSEVEAYDLFSPAEVEREPTTRRIVERVEDLKPQRVFLDALTQLRYLTPDPLQFHKQILSFVRFLVKHGATVLFSSEASERMPDDDLQFLSDGIISLEMSERGRTVTVRKFRGSDFRKGAHTLRLADDGFVVIPRLIPEEHRRGFPKNALPTGIGELDRLLHGGIERGTVTIITGPTGVGKTTVGAHVMKEAAARGERSVLYTFEEEVEMLLTRCETIGIPLRAMIAANLLDVVKVEPLRYTADEFAYMVREEAETRESRIIMIDSLEGYHLSVPGNDVVSHVHALCKYLQNMGVTTLLINEKSRITGGFTATEAGISYLADNIIYLRYIEHETGHGMEVRKAIGILKKRLSGFEPSLHEFAITPDGVRISHDPAIVDAVLSTTPRQLDVALDDGRG